MARVRTVVKSKKSPGSCGKCSAKIKAGQGYRWWKFRYGGKHVRCMQATCAPRGSDLTSSDKLSRAYAAGETVEDAIEAFRDDHDLEALKSAVGDAAEQLREVAGEYRESADNMESGMGSRVSMCDELEEKADSLENQADEMESAADGLEERDEDGDEGEDPSDEAIIKLLEDEHGDFEAHVEDLLHGEHEGYDDMPEAKRDALYDEKHDELVEEKREELKNEREEKIEAWVEEVAGEIEQYTSIEVG